MKYPSRTSFAFVAGLWLCVSVCAAQNPADSCAGLLKRLEEMGKKQAINGMYPLVLKAEAACKAEFGAASKQYADAVSMRAFLYGSQGRYKDALDQCLKERSIRNALGLPRDDEEYGNLQSNMAQLNIYLSNMETAKIHNDSALAIALKVHGKADISYGNRLLNAGTIFFKKANPDLDSAEYYCRASVLVLKTENDSSIMINALNMLGLVLKEKGQWKNAIDCFVEARNISSVKYGPSHILTVVSRGNEATILFEEGRYFESEQILQQVVKSFEANQFTAHPIYRKMIINLFASKRFLGKYDEALQLFNKALSFPIPPNPIDSAESFAVFATLPQLAGKEREAVDLLLKAEHIYEHTDKKDVIHQAQTLSNLGVIYNDMGDYEQAALYFDKVITFTQKVWKEPTQINAILLHNTANNLFDQGQPEKADSLLHEALAIARSSKTESPILASIYYTCGYFYYRAGQYEQARHYLDESRRIREKTIRPEAMDYCRLLVSMANVENKAGHPRKAVRLFEKAIGLLEKGSNEGTEVYSQTLAEFAECRLSQGKNRAALTLFQQAQARLFNRIDAGFSFLSENGKERFLQKNEDDIQNPRKLAFRSARQLPESIDLAYDNELAIKGILQQSVQSVTASIATSGDKEAISLFQQWKTTKQLLALQFSLPADDRLVQQHILDSLSRVADRAEVELTLRSSAFRAARARCNWEQVRNSLSTGEAAIEFTHFRYPGSPGTHDSVYYAALVLRPGDRHPAFVPLFEESALIRHLESANSLNDMAERVAATYLGPSETRLYQIVWKPLEPLLEGVKTIYYAPSGLLHRISFPVIGIATGQPLLFQYDLRAVGSTREITVDTQNIKAGEIRTALLLGGIRYDADSLCLVEAAGRHTPLPEKNPETLDPARRRSGCGSGRIRPLPGTQTETDNLNTELNVRIPTRLLQGCDAREEEIKALGRREPPPGLLHIATHGFFCNDDGYGNPAKALPLFRSGLLLAGAERAVSGDRPLRGMDDGILYAYEVADLSLVGTKLVVLSACETALGDIRGGEGVYGLARAFRLAGAEHVIMSLWQISDTETVRFMDLFYQNWFKGQDIRDAFRDTQRELQRQGAAEDVWGAFLLL